MAIPDYQTLMRPVLQLAAEEERTYKEATALIARQFNLSPAECEELLPSGKRTKIANRVGWAVTYMVKAGLIERPRRGRFQATNRGRDILRKNQHRVDNQLLRQFKEFQDFEKRSNVEAKQSTVDDQSIGTDEALATPEERIANAFQELNSTLRDELLERIGQADPSFFERLIIDLMVGMGYGGSGSSQHLGKTNDGGVDGVINEDPLGLDIVFLQAKRYAPGNSIGVDKIREFAGSLDEKGAVKGVFVTTSHFAPKAKEYAERSPKRLVLIDGDELTRLMVQYGVGVRTFQTLELRKIDEDFFSSDD